MTAVRSRTGALGGRHVGGGRRVGRRILRWSAIAGVAMLCALAGLVWYYSNQLRADLLTLTQGTVEYSVGVLDVDAGQVILERTERSMRPGIQGLEWRDGYGQVGDVLEHGEDRVTRGFRVLEGSLAPGELVGVRSFAFPGDPERAFGMAFEEVFYDSPLGPFPAWLVDGERDTWVIYVHGKGAPREEALRLLPTLADLGYPQLVITYRNDPEPAASADGRYHFGDTEWEDLEAAVRFALAQGATDVVLVGYSTGGAISAAFLAHSPLAALVRGAVLDAPFLDVGAAVDLDAAKRGLPQFLPALAKRLSALRFGIDWVAWDRVDEVAALDVPVLLIHGTADDRVPVEISDRLAAARPEITYLRVPEAGHVASWNLDPAQYETALREFLAELDGHPGVMPVMR